MTTENKVEYVYIDGYWKDDPTDTFENYRCKLNTDHDEYDEYIFFYFEGEHELDAFMGKDGREGCGDFVVTSYRKETE
jgi:hypothetical protein